MLVVFDPEFGHEAECFANANFKSRLGYLISQLLKRRVSLDLKVLPRSERFNAVKTQNRTGKNKWLSDATVSALLDAFGGKILEVRE